MNLVIFLIQLGQSARHCRQRTAAAMSFCRSWPLCWVVICMSLLFALFHCPSTDPSLCFDVRAERICWTLNLLTLNLKIYMSEWIKSAGLPDPPAGPVRELFILLRPVIAVSRRAWPASHAVTDSWQMRCGDHALVNEHGAHWPLPISRNPLRNKKIHYAKRCAGVRSKNAGI